MTGEDVLKLFEQYEKVSRETLTYNVRKAMEPLKLTERGQYLWLADLCCTTRNTTYSWFAPHRDAKVPLKVLAQISVSLNKSMEDLLCAQLHPEWSFHEIAKELGIAEGTVIRHLKHIQIKPGLQEQIYSAEQRTTAVPPEVPSCQQKQNSKAIKKVMEFIME